jgi:hypothetical protein
MPERRSEMPNNIRHLADELDRSGADERVEALEESGGKLSDHIGMPVETNYTGIEIPADADERVVEDFWPNGEPLVIRTYFRN